MRLVEGAAAWASPASATQDRGPGSRPPLPPSRAVRLFGLVVAAAFPVDLPAPPASGPADVRLEAAPVAEGGTLLWRATAPTGASCWRQDGAVVLAWAGCRVAVTPGRVVVDAPGDPGAAFARFFQPIWAALLGMRGTEVLHGSAADRGSGAVAVLGISGVGKSSAALALTRRGWQFVTDDLVAFDAAGGVIPGPPFVRVAADAVPGSGRPPSAAGDKVRLPAPAAAARPPRTVVILDDRHPRLARLRTSEAVDAILRHVYLPVVVHPDQAMRRLDVALTLARSAAVFGAPPRSLTAAEIERLALEG